MKSTNSDPYLTRGLESSYIFLGHRGSSDSDGENDFGNHRLLRERRLHSSDEKDDSLNGYLVENVYNPNTNTPFIQPRALLHGNNSSAAFHFFVVKADYYANLMDNLTGIRVILLRMLSLYFANELLSCCATALSLSRFAFINKAASAKVTL